MINRVKTMSGDLNNSPANIIQQLLIDLGLGTDPDNDGTWPIYYSHLPDAPDDAISIVDQDGILSGSDFEGEVQEHHGIQVLVRSNDIVESYRKCKNIATEFDKTVNNTYVPIGNTTYLVHSIARTSDIISLGVEEGTRRRSHSVNAILSVRMLPGTGSY